MDSPHPSQAAPAGRDGAAPDSGAAMSYGDYLSLSQVLSAQHPRSDDHNEMLFIIQHQTSELWMKLMLHELHAVRRALRNDGLAPACKMLARVARIMDQLVHAWDVLATMTPTEYSAIRPHLGTSSGFQSWQYREIEFLLGNKNPALLPMHAGLGEPYARLHAALDAPSIYDEAIRALARAGLPIAASRLQADPARPTQPEASVEAAWLTVYRAPDRYWSLYELAEKLVDLETAFRVWRFRHATTVERVIGLKTGTGGTEGVAYLKKRLEVVLFPELLSLRTAL